MKSVSVCTTTSDCRCLMGVILELRISGHINSIQHKHAQWVVHCGGPAWQQIKQDYKVIYFHENSSKWTLVKGTILVLINRESP